MTLWRREIIDHGRDWTGRVVAVTLRGSDNWDGAGDLVLTGRVLAIAVRIEGRSGWRRPQYDMVLALDGGQDVRTFAVSRILLIEAEDPQGQPRAQR